MQPINLSKPLRLEVFCYTKALSAILVKVKYQILTAEKNICSVQTPVTGHKRAWTEQVLITGIVPTVMSGTVIACEPQLVLQQYENS